MTRLAMSVAMVACLLASAPGAALAQDEPAEKAKAAKAEETGTISGRVKNRWVARFPAVVYIAKIPGKTFEPPKDPIVADQVQKVFKPRVLPVLLGTKVSFLNSDPFEHNVLSPKPKFDLGRWGQGEAKSRVFDTPGAVTLLCNLHPEMIGYVVVCETPYFATTDEKGKFTIKGVPPGKYTLKSWHERLKPASVEVEVKANETTKVTLKPKK